jgi:hypothetical protein
VSDLQDLIHTNAHNAFAIGIKTERERIIELLDDRVCTDDFCNHDSCVYYLEIIELIQEETK